MKPEILDVLRCPLCSSRMTLTVEHQAKGEVQEGTLTCVEAGHDIEVRDGIIRTLSEMDHLDVQRELEYENATYHGDSRLTDGSMIGRFPDSLEEIWPHTRFFGPDFRDLMSGLVFTPETWTLDIGTASCWSSRLLAQEGGRVVALDINDSEFFGLRAAEIQFAAHGVYFERVLQSMTDLPFENSCFDYVTFNASFHHTPDMFNTISQCHRVLRPGGIAAMVNEEFTSVRHRFTADAGDDKAEGSHHDIQYRRFERTCREVGFEVSYRLAGHVTDRLEKAIGRTATRLAGRVMESNPFLIKQLNSALVYLRKPK